MNLWTWSSTTCGWYKGSGYLTEGATYTTTIPPATHCDLDHSVYAYCYEYGPTGNSMGSNYFSSTINFRGARDSSSISTSIGSTFVTEDTWHRLKATPSMSYSGDVDGSEKVKKIRLRYTPTNAISSYSAAGCSTTTGVGVYTFVCSNGQTNNAQLDICVLPATNCDADFTLSVSTCIGDGDDTITNDYYCSGYVTEGYAVTAVQDAPAMLASVRHKTEDMLYQMVATPSWDVDSDTDNYVIRKIYVRMNEDLLNTDGYKFLGLPSTSSAQSETRYTLTSDTGSGFQALPLTKIPALSLTLPVQCDDAFRLTWYAMVQQNTPPRKDLTGSGVAQTLRIYAIADTPSVATTKSTIVSEDRGVPLEITPSFGIDTDLSDRLRKFRITNVPVGASFNGLTSLWSTTASTIVGSTFTMTAKTSGWATSTKLASFCVTQVFDCDADFTVTVAVFGVEENGKDQEASTTQSIGIVVNAEIDPPTITISPTTTTTEDQTVKMLVTPSVDLDSGTDQEPWYARKLISNPFFAKSTFGSLTSSSSSVGGGVYTLTGLSATSFDWSLMPAYSISSAVQCDVDFTVTLKTVQVNEDDKSELSSTTASLGISISAESDQPSVTVNPSTSVSEDVTVQLIITPDIGFDTDLSDSIRKMYVSGVVPNGLGKLTFSNTGATSELRSTPRYTVTHNGATGFAWTDRVSQQSVLGATACDVDFTLTARVVAVEENKLKDTIESTTRSIAVVISAVADQCALATTMATQVVEDTAVQVIVTPTIGQDTDWSDAIRKAYVTNVVPHGMTKLTFSNSNGAIAESQVGEVYTVSHGGTGFGSGVRISAQSVLGAVDCDIDFSLTVTVASVEENKKDSVETTTRSVGVVISAIVDQPSLIAITSTNTLEDTSVDLKMTPTIGTDTDWSDEIVKVYVSNVVPNGLTKITFSNTDGVTTEASSATLYTLSHTGTGFSSGDRVSTQSVLGAIQCDIDFTLTARAVSVENNGKSTIESTTRSVAVVYSSVADTPTIATTASTNMNEDSSVQLIMTPTLPADTDLSELLRRAYISGVVPNGMTKLTFVNTQGGIGELQSGQQYTLTDDTGTGFGSATKRISKTSVFGAAQCDIDFTVTVRVLSIETNGLDEAESTTRSIGVVISAVGDQPSVVVSSTTEVMEDGSVALTVTPGYMADTDYSDSVIKIYANNFVPNGAQADIEKYTFLSIVSTLSEVANARYTVTMPGTGFGGNVKVAAMSILPAAHTDIDFTVSVRVLSVEVNNPSTAVASTTRSIGVVVSAGIDSASLAREVTTQVTEDISVQLLITPGASSD
eukprot:Rmarinus@m.7937